MCLSVDIVCVWVMLWCCEIQVAAVLIYSQ
jgi:hypothetical protein